MVIINSKTDKTPLLSFNENNKELNIEGICIPENPLTFFDSVTSITHTNISDGKLNRIKIYLEYFNTASSKCLLDLLYSLHNNIKYRNNIIINWVYQHDDTELLESGKVFEELSQLKFEYTELPE